MSNIDAHGGRAASIARRQALAAGKAALAAPRERVRSGFREAHLPGMTLAAAPSAFDPNSGGLPSAGPAAPDCATGSCREQARARRAEMACKGRGAAPAAGPSRPPREGRIDYAPKVVASPTQGGQRVTGLRIGRGSQVTGDEPGAGQPVSGTQYIGTNGRGAAVPAAAKVGYARTVGGNVVSGTQVRSGVRITGDEAGERQTITGQSDAKAADDLTPRSDAGSFAAAQFQRQANPHGASVFGTNLGRSLKSPGSRDRDRQRALETTDGGQSITGTAVGRSIRVTGDADGVCRTVTGDQYLSPARSSSECGGTGGGTAPARHLGTARRDPVSGSKVNESRTWGAQRVTGPSIEHRPNVTGDEPGSCVAVTGTNYQGPSTALAWCDPDQAEAMAEVAVRRPGRAAVTGDRPLHDKGVTGTGRGATRDITGTPYYRSDASTGDQLLGVIQRLQTIDSAFSVTSPQRQAQLLADQGAAAAPTAQGRITGSFAFGEGKITGNSEFLFHPRQPGEGDSKRRAITGEGRTEGTTITGDAWAAHGAVTGTEGYIAAERNPSLRAGKPHGWAGAGAFKGKGHHDEPKQIITGMVGWSAKSAAKVTLSGGAQG